jgi:DNA-binding FadR family transcriptional regulator
VIGELPEMIELSLRDHRAILEAVKNKNKEQAREAMLRHLQAVKEALVRLGCADDDKVDAV